MENPKDYANQAVRGPIAVVRAMIAASRRRARILFPLLVVALVGGLGMVVPTAPANATVIGGHATAEAATTQAVTPDTDNVVIQDVVCAYETCIYRHACVSGAYPLNGWLLASQEPIVENNCTVRVWLHQYSNGKGYALCIRKGSKTGVLKRSYEQFQITTNPTNCPS